MKKCLLFLCFSVVIFTAPLQAHSYIVDTGQPTTEYGWSLSSQGYVAAQFTLDTAYTLTDIEGYIFGLSGTENDAIGVAIYGDGGELPNVSNEFYYDEFTLGSTSAAWYGLSGLDWDLLIGYILGLF